MSNKVMKELAESVFVTVKGYIDRRDAGRAQQDAELTAMLNDLTQLLRALSQRVADLEARESRQRSLRRVAS